jgi:DNA polymerase III subunit gamma/tau
MLSAFGELEPRFRKSGQQQLLMETLLVRFALLDRTVEIEDLLRGLTGSGAEAPSSRPAPSPSRSPEPPRGQRESAPRPVADDVPAAERIAPNEAPVLVQPSAAPADMPTEREARSTTALGRSAEPLELSRVAGRWDDLVAKIRADGKRVLASALEHALPAAVTAAGDLTIELDEPNEFIAQAIEAGRADVLTALRQWFGEARAVRLRQDPARAKAPPARVTDAMVRTDRLNSLKKRDPILGAAIDALDLDVID